MHFCADELYAILNALAFFFPWAHILVFKIRSWIHDRLSCNHHHTEEE